MSRLHTRLPVRIVGAWLTGFGLASCADAESGCPDMAAGDAYRIEYAEISDACVAQHSLKTTWQTISESSLTIIGWVEDGEKYTQEQCSFQFSNERFDPRHQEVFVFKGDDLIGDETGFHGMVSLEWSHVDVSEYRKDRATAKRTPFCTATAKASFIREPMKARGSSSGAIGSATEEALKSPGH